LALQSWSGSGKEGTEREHPEGHRFREVKCEAIRAKGSSLRSGPDIDVHSAPPIYACDITFVRQ
jgi:hypothetical protein